MIRLTNIEKSYRHGVSQTFVLRRITSTSRQGDFVSIMGPSGAGKTTLLHILGMHDSAWSGEYWLHRPAGARARRTRTALRLQKQHIGFVFQSYHLLDNLTVYENIDLPLSYRDVKTHRAAGHGRPTSSTASRSSARRTSIRTSSRAASSSWWRSRAPWSRIRDHPRRRADRQPALDQGREIMELFAQASTTQGTTIVQVTHSEANAAFGRRRSSSLKDGWDRRWRPDDARRAILIADDQRDVLEALRLLLKGEGYLIDTRRLAGRGRCAALEPARLRRRPHRPQLRARHDLGRGRARPAAAHPRRRRVAAGGRDDGVGLGRPRGRGDAARRARLRREAVGQRAAARDRAHADRARPRAAPRPPARGGEPARCRPTARSPLHRRVAGDAAGAARSSRASARRTPTCSSPARTAPARAWWRRRCTPCRRAPRGRWSRSTPAASPKACSRASCSAT